MSKDTPQYRIPPQETADQIWDAFVKQWGPSCWYCGQDTLPDRRTLQLDHVAPKEPDGSNDDCWNRALACPPCNSDKSNKLTPQQTIEKARAAGRIPTNARMQEQLDTFHRRTTWAKTRWQLEIKPNHPPKTYPPRQHPRQIQPPQNNQQIPSPKTQNPLPLRNKSPTPTQQIPYPYNQQIPSPSGGGLGWGRPPTSAENPIHPEPVPHSS